MRFIYICWYIVLKVIVLMFSPVSVHLKGEKMDKVNIEKFTLKLYIHYVQTDRNILYVYGKVKEILSLTISWQLHRFRALRYISHIWTRARYLALPSYIFVPVFLSVAIQNKMLLCYIFYYIFVETCRYPTCYYFE